MLASNLLISQMPRLSHVSLQDVSSEKASTSPEPSMAGGYLSDLVTVTSDDSIESNTNNEERGNWRVSLEFILSCLGYVVGLGNIWRFPYLVYRNGGGAFFIPYLVMLVFCGIPLVLMEMAFAQYASLGPVTIWKAVPLFKGIGYAMIITQAIVAIYYNVINAWAFHYLFSSMTSALPWATCGHKWNTDDCRMNPYWVKNCSWINETYLEQIDKTENHCLSYLQDCINPSNNSNIFQSNNITDCVSWLEERFGEGIYLPNKRTISDLKEPSEEYFYNKVLSKSEGLQSVGVVQWQLALYLLLCWVIVFLSLLKGIHSAGKIAYFAVIVPFLLILLIQALIIDGHLEGIKFYVAPEWEKLLTLQVWGDAASQVFFSLSACAGGLTALSSYNRFYNNIYRDAVIVCLVDTLFSILAGFLVFSSLGILANELKTTVTNVVDSNIGLVFMAFPATVSHFELPAMWSIFFFIMVVLMGLTTMLTLVETIVTAILDEYSLLRTNRWWRIVVLAIICCTLYLLGLPLTTQGGIFLIQLLDEFCGGIPFIIIGLFMCSALAWIYNVRRFCTDIKQMIETNVSLWWRVMWVFFTPAIIVFILILNIIDGIDLDPSNFPDWSYGVGVIFTVISVISIPVVVILTLKSKQGSLLERFMEACKSDEDWGPAVAPRQLKNVDFYPAVHTQSISTTHSCPDSPILPIKTVTDRTDLSSTPLKLKALEHTSYFSFQRKLSTKKSHLDIRHQAILNQAYSASNGSIDKLHHHVTINEFPQKGNVIFIAKKVCNVETSEKSTQTDAKSYTRALKRGSLKSRVQEMTVEESPTKSSNNKQVVEVDVERF